MSVLDKTGDAAIRAGRQYAGRQARNAAGIGRLCAFLCSEHAGYITGQAIYLDGGRTQTPV